MNVPHPPHEVPHANAPGQGQLQPLPHGQYPAAAPAQYPAAAPAQYPAAAPAQYPAPGHAHYPPPGHAHYAPPAPAPINIVVQNTQNAASPGGGLVRVADRSKSVAIVLALFLGGLGIHRFYLGQHGTGVFYLLICWTGIPMFIGLFEAVMFLCMSTREFDMKYNLGLR